MVADVVTMFGGSGFLGRRVVARLVEQGGDVRIAVRHPERAGGLAQGGRAGQVTCIAADVWDEASVIDAIAGSAAVINCVGHYVEKSGASFDAIHGRGAEHVARQAKAAGIRRLVHISGIGADPESASPYVRARAKGERLVADAFPGATILRPSVLFGPDDNFFNMLARMARYSPVLPLFGSGGTRLQPVFVDDVGEACARFLTDETTAGQIYELGGPDIYTYRDLLRLVLDRTGRWRPLIPVPFVIWNILAALAAVLPNPPVTRDQITLMGQDNVVTGEALAFEDLGIDPTAAADVLPRYAGFI